MLVLTKEHSNQSTYEIRVVRSEHSLAAYALVSLIVVEIRFFGIGAWIFFLHNCLITNDLRSAP